MDWTIWLLPSCSQLRRHYSLHPWVRHCSTSSQTWSPPRAISSKIVRKLLILHAELSLWDSESCPGKTTTNVEWELIHANFLPYCFKCYQEQQYNRQDQDSLVSCDNVLNSLTHNTSSWYWQHLKESSLGTRLLNTSYDMKWQWCITNEPNKYDWQKQSWIWHRKKESRSGKWENVAHWVKPTIAGVLLNPHPFASFFCAVRSDKNYSWGKI